MEAARLVHAALDLGITLFDTARSYGASEERLGRALRGRRHGAVISTKVGYGIEGVADWTSESVRRGIEDAMATLRTDWLDIVHLHSCPAETLRRGEVIRALVDAKTAGRIRVVAYSGDNDALDEAVAQDTFGSTMLSLNPWDQGAIDRVLWKAKERGLGAIAKRPLANAWWTFSERPDRPDIAAYWDRGRVMLLPEMELDELAIRFAAFTWGIDSAIAGTTSVEHLERLARHVARGPLPPEPRSEWIRAWRKNAAGWPGIV
jgi:aryl-alcohol dehydrogenase-like predicted oxidoreductase